MDRHISDDQLDRAVIRLLAERADEIEASGITPGRAAARFRSRRRPVVPRRLVWVGLLALLAAADAGGDLGQRSASSHRRPSRSRPAASRSRGAATLYVAAPDGSDERLVDRADTDADEGICDIALRTRRQRAIAVPGGGDTTQTRRSGLRDGERLGSFSPVTDEGIRFDWAPDGQHLAIHVRRRLVPHAIAIVGLDGRSEASLPLPDGFGRNTSGGDVGPLWSPDGRWIAVAGCQSPCDTKSETHILLVAADGSGYRWLTDDPALQDYSMAWSVDSRLAIGRLGGRRTVDVMSSDGSLAPIGDDANRPRRRSAWPGPRMGRGWLSRHPGWSSSCRRGAHGGPDDDRSCAWSTASLVGRRMAELLFTTWIG